MKNIGTALRKLRDRQKLSSREVAERVGVAQSTYLAWESERTSPSLSLFRKLAQAFEMEPLDLMVYLMQKSERSQFDCYEQVA